MCHTSGYRAIATYFQGILIFLFIFMFLFKGEAPSTNGKGNADPASDPKNMIRLACAGFTANVREDPSSKSSVRSTAPSYMLIHVNKC